MRKQNTNAEDPYTAGNAITAAIEAIAEYHREITASGDELIAKVAEAARSLGWPDQVVSNVVDQLQTVTNAQLQLMNNTMELWRERIRSWPDLTSAGKWPDPDDFKAVSVDTARLWKQTGEQWQKNWAQMMMSQWTGSQRRGTAPNKEDRE